MSWATKESLGIQDHRDPEEGKDLQDYLVKKGIQVPRGILGLQGQMAQKDQMVPEDSRENLVMQEKEVHGVSKGQEDSLVVLVPMAMVTREEKARRVNLDSLAILVCKEKTVIQAVEERRGPRESEGRGAVLDFLGLLELQVTKAHQEKWA